MAHLLALDLSAFSCQENMREEKAFLLLKHLGLRVTLCHFSPTIMRIWPYVDDSMTRKHCVGSQWQFHIMEGETQSFSGQSTSYHTHFRWQERGSQILMKLWLHHAHCAGICFFLVGFSGREEPSTLKPHLFPLVPHLFWKTVKNLNLPGLPF